MVLFKTSYEIQIAQLRPVRGFFEHTRAPSHSVKSFNFKWKNLPCAINYMIVMNWK